MADSTRQAIPKIEGQRGLDAIDPTERLQELKQELLEVMAQASYVEDQESLATCHRILSGLRKATALYDKTLGNLYAETVTVYESRPEAYNDRLRGYTSRLKQQGIDSVEVGRLIPLPTQKRTG